jgi:hypothetical protein
MSLIVCTLLGCGLLTAADADRPTPLRYVRPEGDKFVLECEVSTTTTPQGTLYVSRTERPDGKMTLTLRLTPGGKVLTAEAVLQGRDRRVARLDLEGPMPWLKRGGTTEFIKAPKNPVVTTAPDWSDVFQLVRRYDADKGGRQEFAGLWFHPGLPMLTPTFTIERQGADTVMVGDRAVDLSRYKVQLRSGAYLVWARSDGVVCRLVGQGDRAVPVVLQGYEEATRDLK